MKKILLLLIAVFLMVGCNGGNAGSNENYNSSESTESSESKNRDDNCVYNNFYWGDDKEYVIAEKGEPVSYRPDNSIEYNESFMIDDCRTFYYFDDDWKLYKIEVSVVDSLLGEDIDAIKDMVIEMYGEPLSEEIEDMEYGFNICKWERDNTDIELDILQDMIGCYSVTYSKK